MTNQANSSDSTGEPLDDEIWEEEEEFEEEEGLLGKGMRPLLNADMINFLRWLKAAHPEIVRIRDITEQGWQQISQEAGIPLKVLAVSIVAMHDRSNWKYDTVRDEQARLRF